METMSQSKTEQFENLRKEPFSPQTKKILEVLLAALKEKCETAEQVQYTDLVDMTHEDLTFIQDIVGEKEEVREFMSIYEDLYEATKDLHNAVEELESK